MIRLTGVANVPLHVDNSPSPSQNLYSAAVAATADTSFLIPHATWLKLLTQAGSGWTRLVELPATPIPDETAWAGVVGHLAIATSDWRSGRYREARGECRLAIEGIGSVLGSQWAVRREDQRNTETWLKEIGGRMASAWPNDAEAGKLLTALYAAALAWSSPDHHYGAQVPEREEASMAVNLTSSLLSHAGYLLRSHPERLKPSRRSIGSPPSSHLQSGRRYHGARLEPHETA